jgi:dTDP-4-dehydrorhamnose reductase
VGDNLCRLALKKKIPVLGLSRTGSEIMGIVSLPRDLSQHFTLDSLRSYNINGLIHLAANSNVNDCEEQPSESEQVNVRASLILAQFAKDHQIPFVFASSDQVFDGEKGNYTPEDEAKPLNAYGKQKLKAEQEILKLYPKAVICRLPLMIGPNGGYEKAFVEHVKSGKQQTLFTDEIRSVAKVEEVSEALLSALTWNGGIYHLGGPKALNRYELGLLLAEKHGLNKNLLKPGLQADVQMKAKRPKNVSMVSRFNL